MPSSHPMPMLPRLVTADPTLKAWADALVAALERHVALMNAAAGGAYTVTNPTPTYALDEAVATLAQTRQVLGTLIKDLQTGGSIG